MQRFAGRVAMVTGGAGGIGSEVARRLAAEGAEVALLDREEGALRQTADRINAELGRTRLHPETLDVTDPGRVSQTVRRIASDLGRLDILVNNAGILRDAWVDRMSDEEWRAVLDVNLSGAFYCCRAAVPAMKKRDYGRIVNLSSQSRRGNPGQANYSASKAGLVGLTRTLALELVRFGINVNAVAPGAIDTPMTRGLRREVRERLVAIQPGGRMGTVQEVAAVVAFFCSEESSFVTGQVLSVCGGKSVGMGGIS